MSSPETNPEQRGNFDNLGKIALLHWRRVLFCALLGAGAVAIIVKLADLSISVIEKDIRQNIADRSSSDPYALLEGNRWVVEHGWEMVISGAVMGGGIGLAWAIEEEKNA